MFRGRRYLLTCKWCSAHGYKLTVMLWSRMSRTPFDASGHPEAAVDALGRETRTVFDRRGNLTLHLDAAGHVTRIEYGTERRKGPPRARPDALGHTWTHAYDARGNRIRSTDPLGRSTATGYDARSLSLEKRATHPPRFLIQSAVPMKLSRSRTRSASGTPVSPIAWSMHATHWSRSLMPMENGMCRMRRRGWPKRSM